MTDLHAASAGDAAPFRPRRGRKTAAPRDAARRAAGLP